MPSVETIDVPPGFRLRRVREHGIRANYLCGCRCGPCIQANRDYDKAWYRTDTAQRYYRNYRRRRRLQAKPAAA